MLEEHVRQKRAAIERSLASENVHCQTPRLSSSNKDDSKRSNNPNGISSDGQNGKTTRRCVRLFVVSPFFFYFSIFSPFFFRRTNTQIVFFFFNIHSSLFLPEGDGCISCVCSSPYVMIIPSCHGEIQPENIPEVSAQVNTPKRDRFLVSSIQHNPSKPDTIISQ